MKPMIAFLVFSAVAMLPLQIYGQTAISPQDTEIGIVEHLDEYIPLDRTPA